MTLLVTGGAGFIGGEVVRLALERGDAVRVLDSLRADVHAASVAPPDGVEFVHGDVRDPAVLDRALAGVDAVFHEAAKVGLGVDLQDAPDYVASNVLGTAELAAALARARVGRLVLASSMVVYGEGAYRDAEGRRRRPAARTVADLDAGRFEPRDPETGHPLEPDLVDEDDVLDPRNVYALTKLAQEHLASAWARSTGGRAALLRYHNVYGPRMPRDTPYAGVAAIFRSSLARGGAPRVFEDGAQRRDFVHVTDVAGANLAAADALDELPGGTARAFNVGSGVVTTVGELAAGLARAMGGPEPIVTGEYRLGDVRHITASSARARAELDWAPRVALADGLAEFASAEADSSAADGGGPEQGRLASEGVAR
ncbi:NAD-dependent epimerase/dehydratase family protein [Agromyces bracchium]|uniref:NAD-dependent epimerase/dehydratase family protein n=1 Tax=Agromyces bracchium TaxID=88376 RepID=A0A6I3M8Y5_9MICO|nr:NAD-dependent epimerase/dehydratase family protein [Agromyces bracchium]MTH67826.1 NAD-dependent epimerase/dehydratase family protein [Agromyces bracchium]